MTLQDPRGIWVKVDGVCRAEDAVAAVDAGVSAVGMIFAPSPRRVMLDVNTFAGNVRQHDDITCLVLRATA